MFPTIPGAKVAQPPSIPTLPPFLPHLPHWRGLNFTKSQSLPESSHAYGPLLVTIAEAAAKPRRTE